MSQSLGEEQIQSLTLPALEARRFGKDTGCLIDAGSSADGAAHFTARTHHSYKRPHNWHLSRWTRHGARYRASEIEMPDFRPVEPPAPASPAAKRAEGASAARPPRPAIVIELRVRAERAGQGLLSVRVGPRGATGTAGSAMVGRSFTVEVG
ncbi:hypothetical protein WMF45_12730 [Sorangium sp. So ce448]|uniref:hypothetical protein n=1 Tax=Sorangium sp. So ce448 TaxID=3133314 RepID=UPI003F61E99B